MILSLFSGAEVRLTLRSESFDVASVFSAGSAGAAVAAEGVIFEDQISLSAKTSEVKDFNERSSGIIVIYNAYSSEPQSLVAQTRFETPDGKIYRTTKSVVVPGAKIIDGKVETSSVEAAVLADRTGEEYNIGMSDFTIPGFKGTPKYEKFYGRSKTAMSGGFVGKAKVVSEKEVLELRKKIEDDLRAKLTAKVSAELPDGFFAPSGAYIFESSVKEIKPQVGSKSDEFAVAVGGQLKAFFLRKEDVAKQILSLYKNDSEFENINILNFDSLDISAKDADFKAFTAKLAVSGKATAVWSVPAGELVEKLISAASGAERLEIFGQYPQIKKADIIYKPSWWRVFPDEAGEIVILSGY